MKPRKITTANPNDQQPISLMEFFGAESIEKAAELYEHMQKPIIRGVDFQMDTTLLHHWVKQLKEHMPGKMKKYSFTEFIWLKTVEQLRKSGLSFPILIEFKKNLMEPITLKGVITKLQQAKQYIEEMKVPKSQKEQLLQFLASPETMEISDEVTFTLFHVLIMECILKKLPLSLAVFLDGTYIILDKSKERLLSDEYKTKLLFETHTVVSVAAILKRFIHSDLSGFVIPELGLLSYPENKLFEVMRSGDYESILVTFKDKKIKSLELKKSEDVKERIIDILDKSEFGEIIVKKHKGIITKIENTIKVTL